MQNLGVELRGSYADIKLWLRELLARYPEVAVVSLDVQRPGDADGRSVSASIELRAFARPPNPESTKAAR